MRHNSLGRETTKVSAGLLSPKSFKRALERMSTSKLLTSFGFLHYQLIITQLGNYL